MVLVLCVVAVAASGTAIAAANDRATTTTDANESATASGGNATDADGDGLSAERERAVGTDPRRFDTDADAKTAESAPTSESSLQSLLVPGTFMVASAIAGLFVGFVRWGR